MDNITAIIMVGAVGMNLIAFIAGYVWGRHNERVDWNDLIEEGYIDTTYSKPREI